jgi:hypothetical protein
MTLPLYRCWKSSETEIVAALDSSWKSQYREFEFTSLRQQVSTAEKPCDFPLKIAENPRNSACFALKPDSEKVSCWTQKASFADLLSGGLTGSPDVLQLSGRLAGDVKESPNGNPTRDLQMAADRIRPHTLCGPVVSSLFSFAARC